MKEFFRETDQFFASFLPPVVRQFFYFNILTTFVYFLLVVSSSHAVWAGPLVDRIFVLRPDHAIFQLNLWQFITYGFTHQDFFHLLFNMIGLVVFGPMIESRIHDGRFKSLIWLAIITTAITHSVAMIIMEQGQFGLIGFSGAIYAILVAAMIVAPREVIYVNFILPVPVRILVAIYLFFMILGLLGGGISGSNVSHLAHLTGAVTGFLALKFPRILDRFESFTSIFSLRRGKRRSARIVMGHPGRHSDPDDRYNDPHWRLDQ